MPNSREIRFIHRQFAHCETGAAANLLHYHGVNMSEALVFGIGSGLFFGYFPFLKVQGFPLITFRNAPGRILKSTAKRLNMGIRSFKFKDPEKAMDALDRTLEEGIPVGLQTGVYWLPYFPAPLRFHFNAHTLVVYGRRGDEYLISDPVFDEPVTCSRKDLMKARFAEGMLAPKGKMYYMREAPREGNLPDAVRKGIKETFRVMVKTPVPFVGVRGIRFLARRIETWPEKYGKRRASQYLGHAIRMQEEIGTGGGGFRLMYAAFLQEAAAILNEDRLLDLSRKMTAIGDRWREFAVSGARICKGRASEQENFGLLKEILLDCGAREEEAFKALKEVIG